jgi:hypothetical protein
MLIYIHTYVRVKFGNDFPGVITQWEEFLASAPQTDDANEYVRENPLYVPFSKELFGIDPEDETFAHGRDDCVAKNDQIRQDSSIKAKDLQKEVWRTLPCMKKNSVQAFERVKQVQCEGINSRIINYCICSSLMRY